MRLLVRQEFNSQDRKLRVHVLSELVRKKRVFKKWNFIGLVGAKMFLKRNFILSKKKRFFSKAINKKKIFVLKKLVEVFCKKSTYNLIISVRSKSEYIRLKTESGFSTLEGLNFDFWYLKGLWITSIFKQNSALKDISKLLNGSFLVLKTNTLTNLVSVFDLFTQKSAFCVGLFVNGCFYWPDYFFNKINSFSSDIKCFFHSVRFLNKMVFDRVKFFFINFLLFLKRNISECQLSCN